MIANSSSDKTTSKKTKAKKSKSTSKNKSKNESDFINIDDYIDVIQYRKNNEPYPQYPFRMLIAGPSGCGKTNMVINMINNMVFDKLYVFCRDTDEEKYDIFLRQYLDKIAETRHNEWIMYYNEMTQKQRVKLAQLQNCSIDELPNKPPIPFSFYYHFSEEPEEIPDPNDFTKEFNIQTNRMEYPITIMIFDDLIRLKDKSKIIEIYIRGRKRGINPVFISQAVTPVDKDIRLQCSDIILYKCKKKELINLGQNFAMDLDNEDFYRAFRRATKRIYNFFYINDKTPLKSKAFRRNFTPGSLFVDSDSEDSESDDY